MISRRRMLAAATLTVPAVLAACRSQGAAQPAPDPVIRPLKSLSSAPIGCCVQTPHLQDPVFTEILTRHFSQITPEWQMKMEYILPDGSSATDPATWRWDAPDAIAGFAKANGMRLYGTTLVWYAEKPPAFEVMDGQRGFEAAYRAYIDRVVRRYSGAAGWDVVNEPIEEDGSRLRDHLWSRNLGQDEHMLIAFETAAAADPDAVLFINEYFLEKIPAKRREYMRLIERLLGKGARLGGIGIQSHLDIDARPGDSRSAIKDLASFGLPIHISELDIGLSREKPEPRSLADQLKLQAALVSEVAEAFMDLPERQRFAFTMWGLRDRDSWLRNPPNAGDGTDQPLLFDDNGHPKPGFEALAAALAAG
jgi:endo-1,4-beta-xylanase